MAGGIKPGFDYGKTDDFCYNILEGDAHVRDVSATILYQMGIDHDSLTYPYQGLEQRATGVEDAHVIDDIVA